MVGFLQLPLAGGFHLDAVAVQGTHEFLRGVRVQRRRLQQQPQLGGERFEFGRPLARSRPGAQLLGENLFVQLLTPRDAGMLHFGGDHGRGRFGCKQQLEALAPAVVGGGGGRRRAGNRARGRARLAKRLLLGGILGAKLLQCLAGTRAGVGGVEERALLGRRGRGLQGPRRLVQVVVLGQLLGRLGIAGVGGEFRVRQDRTAQAEVVAALELHPGAQQRGIPVLRPVPDPARAALLKTADDAGEVAAADHPGFRMGRRRSAVRREFLKRRAVGVGGEQQVHRVNSALPGGVLRAALLAAGWRSRSVLST